MKKKLLDLKYRRTKIRNIADAEWYWYKKALDCILEYLHKGKDLNSASIEEDDTSVDTVTLKGFQQYVCKRIDECEDLRESNKFWRAF